MNKEQQRKHDEKINRLKAIKLARKPTELSIAAFDQATSCGVAFERSGENKPNVQLWDLNIKAKESQGMKWIRFEAKLKKFLVENSINVLAYELPAGRHINPIIHSAKLIGIIEKSCVELGIDYIEFSASEIKKFATNNGNANKKAMIEHAKKLWNYEGEDDNEADALHILHYLKSKINF